MKFLQFAPCALLRPYVRHYYLFQSNAERAFEDTVYPSGDMEVIFNLGEGIWEVLGESKFYRTPPVELWGQITRPLAVKSVGKQTMLGIKFFTHSAAFFFDEGINEFNNRVYDLHEVMGSSVEILHAQLLDAQETRERISFIEQFLLKKLTERDSKSTKIDQVGRMLNSIENNSANNSASAEHTIGLVASQHGITTRYLHKLVHQHTGLSPKEFKKISRFQSSLRLIAEHKQPLTAIAYDCGYFDQSHFIRDFKCFTGVTPSAYIGAVSPVNQLM